MNVAPVILAGGIGSRIYPISTSNIPKQFIKLFSDNTSFFQQTLRRIRKVFSKENIIISINYKHKNIAIKQLQDIKEFNYSLIIEPKKNNNFATILSSIRVAYNCDILFITPSDLLIQDIDNFKQTIKDAILLSYINNNHILFGIKPMEANENFGYIQLKKQPKNTHDNNNKYIKNSYDIERFVEKPNKNIAERLIKQGNTFLNSGMFVLHKNLFLEQVKILHKNSYMSYISMTFNIITDKNNTTNEINNDFISDYIKNIDSKNTDLNEEKTFFIRHFIPDSESFCKIINKSIDYAIIEHINNNIKCIEANFDWFDFGNWKNLLYLVFNNKINLDIARKMYNKSI